MDVEIEIEKESPNPNVVTFKGKPIKEGVVHQKDGGVGVLSYAYSLTNSSHFKTSFPGPHIIDISPCENAIRLTFSSQQDASQSATVELPIREWGPIIRHRDLVVKEYQRLLGESLKEGATKEAKDNFELQHHRRRDHHNASASQLLEDAKRAGIRMDHEEARNLFAVVAGVMLDVIPDRSGSMGGPGAA